MSGFRNLGGLASFGEFRALDHERWMIELPVQYGLLLRVRRGCYADTVEDDAVIQAWRVGGRLICVSALVTALSELPQCCSSKFPRSRG